MSNKTYITDDHNLNDSSIAASSKAISNGLSALMDNIIVAANAAANSQTTIPNNNAVELSNRIEQVAAKNTEQDAAIASKLSTSGGPMTGAIIPTNIETIIRRDDITGSVQMWGANSYDKGSGLQLYGAESSVNAGRFLAWSISQDGTRKYFTLYPDGGITWNGKSLVCSVNGVNADADGNVSEVESSVSTLVDGVRRINFRYTNGIQIEFGACISGTTLTFAKPFNGTPMVQVTHNTTSSNNSSSAISCYIRSLTTTSCMPLLYVGNTLSTVSYTHYFAIGTWK